MDNSLDCRDQVFRFFEPLIGIVDDSAMLVLFDEISVNEPFQWASTVHDVFVCITWNAGEFYMFVDLQGGFLLIGESHFLSTK